MTNATLPPETRPSGGERLPRARRRRTPPALSVSARGEPVVWLAGGALAIAVGMVFSLLALVFYQGMTTFWPSPIVRLELADGSVVMGEVTRDESYVLAADAVANLSDELAANAREALDDSEQLKSRRRLVRIGNYELTNEHFDWVSDFSIRKETRPEWAVVLERVEWGRFYGEPTKFVVRHPRTATSKETDLEQIVQFAQSTPYQLVGEDQQQVLARLGELQSRVQELNEEWKNERTENAKRFLEGFQENRVENDHSKPMAVTDAGELVPLDEWTEMQELAAIAELSSTPASIWNRYEKYHHDVRKRFRRRYRLEKYSIGHVNHKIERARLALREAELNAGVDVVGFVNEYDSLELSLAALHQARENAERVADTAEKLYGEEDPLTPFVRELASKLAVRIEEQETPLRKRMREIDDQVAETPESVRRAWAEFLATNGEARAETREITDEIDSLKAENERYELHLVTARGIQKETPLNEIVRGYPANQLAFSDKASIYASRWLEFLNDDPREANSEGGVFPAIWGTVAMTLIMSLIVTPFGVLAALYLREYARSGWIVSIVRIAINNLAGVPSIVFGVFGLGFFCYLVGGFVDGGPSGIGIDPLPSARWWAVVTVLAAVSVVAFGVSLFHRTRTRHSPARRVGQIVAAVLWLFATVVFFVLVLTSPFFNGLYWANLPNPTFGKGGLLWASLTLALLTLPVVIVATEEALSAVPNSLREGSYASGAGKWQTLRRIVLPHALPGIMTGMILAMARGAGEVAPLMLVGAVKLAPELPFDSVFPFVHGDRSFMHLGFHVYDLGFQSQNSEAAKPMVFTTTLLLITIIALINITAIYLRSRLRRRFQASQF